MKTFKQWVDSFPEKARDYILGLSKSFDKESPTYYTCDNHKIKPEIILPMIERMKNGNIRYDFINLEEAYSIIIGFLLDRLAGRNNALHNVSDDVIDQAIMAFISYRPYESYIKKLPLKYQRRCINAKLENNSTLSLSELLLLTDDFDNINWDLFDSTSVYQLTNVEYAIIPKEKILSLLKKDYSLMSAIDINNGNEIFDTLFFLEDGWDISQKQDVIRKFRHSEEGIENFFKNVIAVDKSYLRYLPLVLNNAGLARRLYSLKKPSEEITEDTPLQETFRYSKEYRRLFMIVRCCNEKHMSKEFARKIGNISSLVKFYDYNYDMIFEAMYPEYAA